MKLEHIKPVPRVIITFEGVEISMLLYAIQQQLSRTVDGTEDRSFLYMLETLLLPIVEGTP